MSMPGMDGPSPGELEEHLADADSEYCLIVDVADKLAVAVLEAVDRGEISSVSKITDTLEAYADTRFNNKQGEGVRLLRWLRDRKMNAEQK